MKRSVAQLGIALAMLLPSTARAQEPGAPATPRTVALVRGECASRVDVGVLAGHVALESSVEIVAPGEATVLAGWAEPPCVDGHVRVSLRDAHGTVLAGPVDLSTEGLSARLEARVVALWLGEALASVPAQAPGVAPGPQTNDAPPSPPATDTAPLRPPLDASRPAQPSVRTPAPPPDATPAPPVHARIAALFALGYAPSTTSSIAGGMLALSLRFAALPVLAFQLDLGETVAWTPFNADLAITTGGLAVLVPVPLAGPVSLELGARVYVSYDAILRANAGITPFGDQLVAGGGALVRAVLRAGALGSLVEVEVGGPFTGFSVRIADAMGGPPPHDTTILDGLRADVRVGITFE